MSLDVGNATLAAAARAAARGDERSMAAVAKQAVFHEALLGAIRARINELRAVAK
jgi:hypothetical protein